MCTDGGCGGLLLLAALAALVLAAGWIVVCVAPVWIWGARALPASLGGSRPRRFATGFALSLLAAGTLLVAQESGIWFLVLVSPWAVLPILARRRDRQV
jgi:hypothetical protein